MIIRFRLSELFTLAICSAVGCICPAEGTTRCELSLSTSKIVRGMEEWAVAVACEW